MTKFILKMSANALNEWRRKNKPDSDNVSVCDMYYQGDAGIKGMEGGPTVWSSGIQHAKQFESLAAAEIPIHWYNLEGVEIIALNPVQENENERSGTESPV